MSEGMRVAEFLAMLERMPAGAAVSYRGWIHDPSAPVGPVSTRTIVAASTDVLVATGGLSTTHLGVVLGRSGKDVSALSAMREAKEVTFRPGLLFQVSRPFEIEGMIVRVYEEFVADEQGRPNGSDIPPQELFPRVSQAIVDARSRKLPVPVEYCERFMEEFI